MLLSYMLAPPVYPPLWLQNIEIGVSNGACGLSNDKNSRINFWG